MKYPIFFVLVMLNAANVVAQLDNKKNTISINISNPLIFGSKANIIAYERIIGKHQSFSVSVGRMSLPAFGKDGNNDSLKMQRNLKDKGFHFEADYRFYLAKENRYEAPRGVYIGPYYSFNHFSRSNEWLLNSTTFNGTVNTTTSLSMNTVGFQLGYQFVFWKKMSLDMILLGPGVGFYNIKAELNTNLSPDQEALFFEKLNQYLGDKIPGYNLVIKEGSFKKNGNVRTTALGYRYMINIGYRF